MQVVSRTHVGLVRENNEDALLVREPYLFAVADGMGGYAAGEIASRSTVKAFEAATYSLRHEMGEQDIRKIMLDAFDKANTHVFKMAVSNEQYTGMGTTMTALYLADANNAYCCHVGDSRLYVIQDGIHQITRDHSLVQEMVRMGEISQEEARNHPDKNIITRALGAEKTVDVDFFDLKLEEGCTILMCSDGLSNMVADEKIAEIISDPEADIDQKGSALLREANQNGGKDNIAVVLVEPFTNEVEAC